MKTRQTQKYNIPRADYKVINQYCQVLQYMGYNREVIQFVKDELSKDFSTNVELYTCKKCKKKKHKVLLNYAVTELPKNRKLCVECVGVHRLRSFTPVMSVDTAWAKVLS